MRRTPLRIIPRTLAAVTELLMGSRPRPQFDQRMEPEIQMVDGNVSPVMPYLLLPGPMYFLEVMEILLDGGAIGNRFEDLLHRRFGVGAEERHPAIGVAHQNHADLTAHRLIRGQEGFVSLDNLLAVKHEVAGLPALSVASTLGQADRLLAV